MAPMGCLPADMNEDGAKDILVYYWGRTPVAFIKQDNGYIQQEITASGEKWYTNAATFSDLDGDGHQDLIIGNYFQDHAEILDVNSTKIEAMQDSMTRAFNGGKNRIFLWSNNLQQGVKYQEALAPFADKIAKGWTLAVGTADLDGDLLPEIYFANNFGPDRLLHNQSTPGKLQFALLEGEKRLNTPNSKVLGHDGFKGMGVDFGDINHDGLLNIYVSNITSEYALEESHFLFASTGELAKMKERIAPYIDISESLGLSRSGWSWETKLADFDNDGELEALQAKGFCHGEINRWAELQELATIPAIGAVTKVELPDGRTLIAQVDGGNGHSGARSPELHFGLGEINSEIRLSVEVQWRDLQGKTHISNFSLAPGNHTLTLS